MVGITVINRDFPNLQIMWPIIPQFASVSHQYNHNDEKGDFKLSATENNYKNAIEKVEHQHERRKYEFIITDNRHNQTAMLFFFNI